MMLMFVISTFRQLHSIISCCIHLPEQLVMKSEPRYENQKITTTLGNTFTKMYRTTTIQHTVTIASTLGSAVGVQSSIF